MQATGKNVVLSPAAFLGQQAFVLLPFTLPVWAAGLWFYGFDVHDRRYRFLAIAYVVTLGLMIALKGKSYYLLPIYPMLGEAAAIDFFGPRYGLPKAISGHQTYFLWDPGATAEKS